MHNVVLVDIGLDGHRLSFNRTFSKILLNLGCRVFLCVQVVPALLLIKQELPEQVENFSLLTLYMITIPPLKRVLFMFSKLQSSGGVLWLCRFEGSKKSII